MLVNGTCQSEAEGDNVYKSATYCSSMEEMGVDEGNSGRRPCQCL